MPLFAFVCSGLAERRSVLPRLLPYCTLSTCNAVEYMNVFSFSSSSTKQKVYVARFWLPLYSAVIISMYAYGIILLTVQ